jgi:hypothetical protein
VPQRTEPKKIRFGLRVGKVPNSSRWWLLFGDNARGETITGWRSGEWYADRIAGQTGRSKPPAQRGGIMGDNVAGAMLQTAEARNIVEPTRIYRRRPLQRSPVRAGTASAMRPSAHRMS